MDISHETIEIGTIVTYSGHNARIMEQDILGSRTIAVRHNDTRFSGTAVVAPDASDIVINLSNVMCSPNEWPRIRSCVEDILALWDEYKAHKAQAG